MTELALLEQDLHVASPRSARFVTGLAESEADVREAGGLRHRVYVEEMHAAPPEGVVGIEMDHFDPYCDHLLVRDAETGGVVGTYRLLDRERATQVGCFYSETEFDLRRIMKLGPRMVEIGRACVHPDYRSGAVIGLLLAGLTRYVFARNYDYVIGCASVEIGSDPELARSVCRRLLDSHLGPSAWRVFPRIPFPLRPRGVAAQPPIPPLIGSYLRLGARVCGRPAWDRDFNTADLLIMLRLAEMNPRYVRRLLRDR